MLSNRTSLITGGTHGIGRAIVTRFLAEGARVVTVARETVTDLPPLVAFVPYVLAEDGFQPDTLRRGQSDTHQSVHVQLRLLSIR